MGGNPADDRAVSDDRLSWDLSAMFEVAPDFSLYARVASGFRAPTIQGRDVAFFSPPSVATSEKIMSYEVGFKSQLADRRVRLNGAVFHYVVERSAVQRGRRRGQPRPAGQCRQGHGLGLRIRRRVPADREFPDHRRASATTTPRSRTTRCAVGICAQCTVTDPTVMVGRDHRALVDGNPFPNAPELDRRHHRALGHADERQRRDLRLHRLDLPGRDQLVPLRVGGVPLRRPDRRRPEDRLRPDRRQLGIAAFARNITNEDNIKGGIDFNNNTAFVNEPRVFGLSGRFRF